MIRWIFFFEEGNVKSDVTDEQEDARIQEFLESNPKGILHLPAGDTDIYVNLDRVKAFSRSIVNEQAESAKEEAAVPEMDPQHEIAPQ